ncbi:uroporphyrinogen-III C-methyltransferase [Candidatus Poribacteria bacterium]|jgi:uroporphyrinogen III methyltransferase / synthase|nr:uroporphyrinogen-III C-methyltransferase [Candidatus Poribacteria bacterium]MBT5532345.1 uroporphyrinogen-III C-methyltransferase [Candidatus Poribacteria bacterium]MBT7097259.1 uroporphyrinogen-III C-methyltransferase [Candidatus Poribacteria bacterium]MBT7808573.1 uroporphyrinogen-III C-methyltransferase [Candidatus Poribacteria bacterium]
MSGIVYLVGAGPGDPKLLTVKGRECLERADVVFYDALANPVLLDLAPERAPRLYVGKRSAAHAVPQEEMNERLVEAASAGKTVVRLKGGDPFIFGRGGEEAERLREAGVPFEIVPGIPSPIAGPAYAGIPLTHRDHASSVAFVTGHERAEKTESTVDLGAIGAAVDTVAILMGTARLAGIVDDLKRGGRSPDTPVALVQWGTRPNQRTLVSTLENVAADVEAAGMGSPAIILVGDVVGLRETLAWFDTKPLFGRRVVVTRAREQASSLVSLLTDAGADVIEFPTIRTEPSGDTSSLDDAIAALPETDRVVFTSANSVRYLWERVDALELDSRALAGVSVAAIGPATQAALLNRGVRPDFVAERSRSEGVVEDIGDVDGQRVLVPRADLARAELVDGLRAGGAVVTAVTAYSTVPDVGDATQVVDLLTDGDIDAVTFTSGSTVQNFLAALPGNEARNALEHVCVAAIGPVTAARARDLGLNVTVEAPSAAVESLSEALIRHFTSE